VKSLVIGASAGLGRALAAHLARAGHDLFLVSSDERDLVAIAADLHLRFNVRVFTTAIDLLDPDPPALRARVTSSLKGLDNFFYIAGQSVMDRGPREDAEVERLITVNFTSGVRLVNAFLGDLAQAEHGNLVGAGSCASARGRRLNSIYGAAKSGLDSYFSAMRHYLVGTPCKVQFYRLGYLATHMTFGQKLMLPASDPDAAASAMVANLGRDLGAVYLPKWWWPVMMIIRMMPWPIFKRLNI
jgi:short-subunit dehydrogenase